LGPQTFTLLAY